MKIIIVLFFASLTTACNTMAGFGRDIQGSAEYMHGKMPRNPEAAVPANTETKDK